MIPLLPPPRMRRCSAQSRSFLLGPDGPCGASTWTGPALRQSHRTTRTGTKQGQQIKVSAVSGELRFTFKASGVRRVCQLNGVT
jgi:hypothetical protein